MTRTVAFAMTWLCLEACGAAPAPVSPGPRASPSPSPSAPSLEAPPAAAAPLSCASALPAFATEPASAAPTPGVGQMSEEAAQAKRLFDKEQWAQAVPALERVMSGDTGDDEGNKQLAAYFRAVALHKGGRSPEAAAAFLGLAAQPTHLKHVETLLWLVKLADSAPVVVHGFGFYDARSAARFANPEQHDVHQGALFLLGRERFERGAKAEAAELFAQVEPSSRWYVLAHECLDRTK